MDKIEAVKTLQQIRRKKLDTLTAINRKRSWRPSEKAMTMALVNREVEALDLSIKALGEDNAAPPE